MGYLDYYYNNNSITKDYTAQEVIEYNHLVHDIIVQQEGDVDQNRTVAVIEYASKPFFGSETTYDVALYEVKEGVEVQDYMWSLKKTPASKDENLQRIATVTIVVDNKSGEVTGFSAEYLTAE